MEGNAEKDTPVTKENNEKNKISQNNNIITNTSEDTQKSHEKSQQHVPHSQKILDLSNLLNIYQPFRESQNSISPEEISILPRLPILKGVDKDLGGNLFSCFKTTSNCPVIWDVAKQRKQVLPSDIEIEKENSPYPKEADQYPNSAASSQTTSQTSQGKKKTGKYNQSHTQQSNATTQGRGSGRHSRQKIESPPKVVHFADYRKPSYRPYVPWCDIISPSRGRRPPEPQSTMPAHAAQEVIIDTFQTIRETKADKAPDLALSALHDNAALVLSLGPPFPISESDNEILQKREKHKLKNKEKYAITLLPIKRNQSIPPHRVLKKIYKTARNDNFTTHNSIQLFLNRQFISEVYSRSYSITPFVRACRFLWPIRRNIVTQNKGQKHVRTPIFEEETHNENVIDIDNSLTVLAKMSNDTYAANNNVAATALNIVFTTPFEIDYLDLQSYFEKKKQNNV